MASNPANLTRMPHSATWCENAPVRLWTAGPPVRSMAGSSPRGRPLMKRSGPLYAARRTAVRPVHAVAQRDDGRRTRRRPGGGVAGDQGVAEHRTHGVRVAHPVPVPDPRARGRLHGPYRRRLLRVAITVRDDKAIAYVCDGHNVESWLQGDVKDDGSLRLTGKDGASLNGTLKGTKQISGTAGVGTREYAFTVDKAKKPSGLYRANSDGGRREDRRRLDRPAGRPAGRHPHPRRQALPGTADRPGDRCGDGRRTAAHGPSRNPLTSARGSRS